MRTFWLSVLLFASGAAFAHAPGLSRVALSVDSHRLMAHAVFAAGDLDAVLSIDTDGDGMLSGAEYAAAEPRIAQFAGTVLRIDDGGRTLPVTRTTHTRSASNAVEFRLAVDIADASAITLTSPILSRLPRGHRQHLTIRDTAGRMLAQSMLRADASFALQLDTHDTLTVAGEYIVEGIWHILIGFDHILFLLTLLLPAVLAPDGSQSRGGLTPVVVTLGKTVTAFTVAHSVTLTLAVLQIVVLPARLVESTIALSVIVACAFNLLATGNASRWPLAFGFGLIHGFGFAGVLSGLALPPGMLAVSLLGFNLGVELGQLALVLLVFPVLYLARNTSAYRPYVLRGGSLVAAAVAAVWLMERVLDQAPAGALPSG